jgi:uncharacterized protein (TIGR02118 family)
LRRAGCGARLTGDGNEPTSPDRSHLGRVVQIGDDTMIAAISLMRRQDAKSLTQFRRHWLDIHGPLVCLFPGLRRYVQCHVVASAAMNEAARSMRIDGFPILYFDSDQDRTLAHHSPEMAACNIDSRQFVGAVSRVITDVLGDLRSNAGRFSLIEIWPEYLSPEPRPVRYRVLEQGAAPNSVIAHLPVTAGAMTQTWFDSLVDLECAVDAVDDSGAARFVVEEHWLV